MGMGHAAAYADVIEANTIKKFCPKEFDVFYEKVGDMESDFELFASLAESKDFADYDDDIVESYNELCNAFHKKTGLKLNLSFHDSDENGDRYDDINGVYWYVDGMYQLTPAGKKMQKYVERKSFVIFG